ncbi:uncharacterized protein si:ch211-276i12.4 isoform X2 [Siniperca chuatsi]|uniref:uncharacterized protein si:ch211-276i12.4 isoform X2 n=1 Tax=Siniperca chuatsi TaxID=119488 RepID=UPI001CE1DAFE|nr:uncharacterized protein si:ch211-276i12.4 isoform X2 [Siniperca chuatsi]
MTDIDRQVAQQRKKLELQSRGNNTDHHRCPLYSQPYQDDIHSLPPGKRQVMEKFFKPVHSPSGPDEIKPRKHHHHHPLHHHRDPQSHRYLMFDDTDRNSDESHGHHRHHQHGHYLHDSAHHDAHHRQTQQFHHSEEDEILYNHETHVTLSRASSSSLSSSSSSSSFSSWHTEASANDPFSLRHAAQPQHSLSCSNITDVRRGFREDDSSKPIVFASIKHGVNGSVCELHGSSQKRGNCVFSTLDRGHSRSDEALLQGNESDLGGEQSRVPHMNYGPLYKTASLNRSLAFSEEDILLGVSRGPKRSVSSIQLPGKGILKNKEPHADIRKAKSMEVLSPRVSKGQDPSGQKGKGITQVEIEQARTNFVQGKLQFSAFLDEITKQVISPSALTILGVNNNKTTEKTPAPAQKPVPVKPQLPPKKHRESSGEKREQHPKQHSRQEKVAHSSSRKHSDCSNPDKLNSYAAKNHHGSPPLHHYPHSPSQNTHHGSSRKDRRPSPTGSSVSGDRYGRCGPHLTDGTSTSPSPEPSQPKQRHHCKQQPTASHSQQTQHFPQHQPQQAHPGLGHRGPTSSSPSSAQGVEPGLRSESSSTKSDSPRARETASTATSHSSEQSGRHHSQHVGHSKQRRDTLCDADHLQALHEENADLHQNLLQTVVCIESLEAELQRTRDELSHVKEKYKSLLETHTGTKQANNLLGEHLHIASESLSSERKYLLNRVSQLSSELEDAHRTMAALENINVPCLIKELLEKHFDSTEAIQKLLTTTAPISHSATSPQADGQSHVPKVEEAAHDWLMKSEAGPQRVTAFIPFKQGVPTAGTEDSLSGQHKSSHNPPFSVADISTAIYKKMAASYAARPQPLYPQSQQQPPLGTNHTDTPPNLQQAHVGGDSWGGKGGVKVTLLEQDVVDVTSMSAQQILDEFMQQLQTHKEAGGGKEQQYGQEWVGGAEQTGKGAD